jgi:hypothetical protein
MRSLSLTLFIIISRTPGKLVCCMIFHASSTERFQSGMNGCQDGWAGSNLQFLYSTLTGISGAASFGITHVSRGFGGCPMVKGVSAFGPN